MEKNRNQFLLNAAIAGIIGAAAFGLSSTVAHAQNAKEAKGHCVGANSCKGKSSCKGASNACKGKNGCGGKGFLEMTKADCDALAVKGKKVKFEESKM